MHSADDIVSHLVGVQIYRFYAMGHDDRLDEQLIAEINKPGWMLGPVG